MRDFYLLLNSSVAIALVVLGVVVFLTSKRDGINRLFLLFTVSVAVWVVAACVSNDVRLGDSVSLYGNYLVFLFSYFASFFLIWFIVRLLSTARAIKVLGVMSPLIILVGLLSATPLVVAGVVPQGNVYAIEFGVLTPLYGVFIIGQLIASVAILVLGLKSAKDRIRRQIVVILSSLLVALPILVVTQFIAPAITGLFEITDLGILIMVLPVTALYISVFRHGLFDIRLATVRAVGYTLTISAMAGIYVLLAYAMSMVFFGGAVADGVGLSPANIAIALILALIFQPIKQFFDHWTNKIFFRGTYSRESFIRDFGKIISYDTNLALLLKQSSTFIKEKLNAESVSFYVNGRTVFAANSHPKKRVLPTDIDMIGAYYRKHHEFPAVLVGDMVESDQIRGILKAYQVHIVLPLMLQGQALGFLFIGEHKSRGYTMRDVRVIESIANELTIAVQNSLSVEEIRELNESLQQRVDVATKELRESNRQLQRLDEAKSEFVSMASHQLRTPLTSIKGYLDMVLQGDLGKVSATQRAVLSEAFLSSERMVTLINDFLNISRLQTGKFVIDRTEGDLKELVVSQISMLQVIAKQHNLTIKETIDKTVPSMNIDVDKLRQVIVNFIDNAIYYSKPGTIVRVKLVREKDHIVFTVKDTGIGVPESEKAKLFTRFFRAQNARRRRPDGTGVGLFLAKKVVVLHGGQIIFESEEDKGSLFGFRVPIS